MQAKSEAWLLEGGGGHHMPKPHPAIQPQTHARFGDDELEKNRVASKAP